MTRSRIWACLWLICAALLIGPALSFSAAQTPSQAPRSPAPSRKPRTLLLPPTLVGGSPATLAVLDAFGRLMPGVVVELSGRPSATTDASGRAYFIAPPGPGVLVAWTSGRAVTATATIQASGSVASASAESPARGLSIVSYPQFLTLYDRFAITGSGFRGEADANHIFIADQPCLVLAASPVSLVALPGMRIPLGAAVLRIGISAEQDAPGSSASAARGTDAPAEASKPVSIVLLEVSGSARNAHPGAQSMLTIQARGTAERVQVELRNSSPSVVQLTGGNVQRITTSGGDQNIAQVPMKFIASGDYTITAHLLSDAVTPASGT